METDAEYKALNQIVKNDQRQRLFIRLLAFVAFMVLLGFLQYVNKQIHTQIQQSLDKQTALIKASQEDIATRNAESRRYITCLLVIPQEQRTVSIQKYCYDKSDLPGGRTPAEFTPIDLALSDQAIAAAAGGSSGSEKGASSSKQPAPSKQIAQSNSPQRQVSSSGSGSRSTPASAGFNVPIITPLLKLLGIN